MHYRGVQAVVKACNDNNGEQFHKEILIGVIKELHSILKDANENCRSAYHIASRDGDSTEWAAFRRKIKKSLERQHSVIVLDIDLSISGSSLIDKITNSQVLAGEQAVIDNLRKLDLDT